MIHENELRIGNWIRSIHSGETKVSLFMMGEFHNDETYLDHLMPIPLTPEILVACGFKNYPRPDEKERRMVDLYFLTAGYVQITFHVGETILCAENTGAIKSGQVILNKSIRYLHQLQNLYFALTGQELNYKL